MCFWYFILIFCLFDLHIQIDLLLNHIRIQRIPFIKTMFGAFWGLFLYFYFFFVFSLPGVVEVLGVRGVPGTSNESSLNATIFNGVGWTRFNILPSLIPLEWDEIKFVASMLVSVAALICASSAVRVFAMATTSSVLDGINAPLATVFCIFGKLVSSIAAFNSLADSSSNARFILLNVTELQNTDEGHTKLFHSKRSRNAKFIVIVLFMGNDWEKYTTVCTATSALECLTKPRR